MEVIEGGKKENELEVPEEALTPEQALHNANVVIGNQQAQIRHLAQFNDVLQGAIEEIVNTTNGVVTEVNKILNPEGGSDATSSDS